MFRRFCKMFSESFQAVGLYCSCHAAQVSMGNFQINILQNLRNKWPPQPVVYGRKIIYSFGRERNLERSRCIKWYIQHKIWLKQYFWLYNLAETKHSADYSVEMTHWIHGVYLSTHYSSLLVAVTLVSDNPATVTVLWSRKGPSYTENHRIE